MLVVVIVLVVTNLVTIGALVHARLRPPPPPRPDPRLGTALDRTLARSVTTSGTRRVISVEILNVGELAGTRGRLAGIAGALVPGLTARIVYDQTIKTMRRQLETEQVLADVRMHTLERVEPARNLRRAPEPGTDRVEPTTRDGLADVDDEPTGPDDTRDDR